MGCRTVTNIININIDENFNKNIKGNSFFSVYGQEGYNILFGIKSLAEDKFWEKYPQYKYFIEESFIKYASPLSKVDYEGTADAVFYRKNDKIFACIMAEVDENNSLFFANNVYIDEKFIRKTSFINPISPIVDIYTSRKAILPIEKYMEYRYTENFNKQNDLIKEIINNFVKFYKVEPLQLDFDFSRFDEVLNQIIMPKYTPQTKEELLALITNEDINLKDIDTSLITDMSGLFLDSTRKDFSGIESWDTSNVKDMSAMFDGATSFNQDISGWDVSNVEDMTGMFENCPIDNSNKPKELQDQKDQNFVRKQRL
ncbi:BspA family leucine-rich repeat surface protein [Campylobacter sp. US33a]|uniref:BspA family leucine-rich repeat surface protein n=1 Tax=Campylobacter sp. US33a TaxID=2498120 RepID=UPI001FBA88DE|nr:BspA family leucine-rich repeat surface protein [Campylobacter sp. US33a]